MKAKARRWLRGDALRVALALQGKLNEGDEVRSYVRSIPAVRRVATGSMSTQVHPGIAYYHVVADDGFDDWIALEEVIAWRPMVPNG